MRVKKGEKVRDRVFGAPIEARDYHGR
jgi:hypothetical protein